MPDRTTPRGQMLVIVAIAMTALVAMAGLVVDGGMAWSNRRQTQNAADAAALAGTRVLGLDLKWRSMGSPGTAPFASPDADVCAAINNALAYNENAAQEIDPIDCYNGSPAAVYVNFQRQQVGLVGDGVPFTAQGVRVNALGNSSTFLMGVVGISEIDVAATATALAGPAEPPLGKLMPFVVQNPLGPFVPGTPYEIRSESEGECGAWSDGATELAFGGTDIVLASYQEPPQGEPAPLADKPLTPIATPGSNTSFESSVTVELTSPTHNAKLYYTIDGSTPTPSSDEYKNNTDLTFTETTVLKAIAYTSGGQGGTSDVGSFVYHKGSPPPEPVIAAPGSGMFTGSQSITLTSPTGSAEIYYTTDGSNPTSASARYSGPLSISTSTVIRAVAFLNLSYSPVTTFTYQETSEVGLVTANPPDGTEFESGISITLSTATAGATIHYTVNGSEPTDASPVYSSPISIFADTTIRAFAVLDDESSALSGFSYKLVGPSCPDASAGNFGWVDFSGGAGGNNELKSWVDDPSTAPTDWYHNICGTKNCRDQHDPDDPADDHWLLEGTTGHRDVTLDIACKYVGQEIYVPIWDSYAQTSKKPNGANAVFHIIGFGVFKLEGVIDTNPGGGKSGKGCGVEDIDGTEKKNDKGFIGTYVDSFIGSQVSPCIPSQDGTNPCTNLGANTAFTINLAQ